MRDILLATIVFGSVPFILQRPHIGVLMWVWLSFMSPHRYTWTFAYDFRFAMMIAAVTLAAWFLSREPKRIPWNLPVIALIAFWGWTSFTTVLAIYPGYAQSEWQNITKGILMNGILVLILFGDRARLNMLIWITVVSIGFFGVKGGMFTLRTGGAYHVYGAPESFFGSNNYLAVALLMTIPLMRYLQLNSDRRTIRWGLTAAMMLCIISVLGSQSRGGFIGLLVLAVALVLRSRKKLVLSVGLAIVMAFGVNFMPESWHERISTILNYEEDASVQGRFDSWDFAIELANERPLTGGGFGAFLANKADTGSGYRAAHSVYFQVLGEHGYVGLLLYMLLLATGFLASFGAISRTKNQPELTWAHDLARLVQVSLFIFVVNGAFSNFAYFELMFQLVAILVALNVVIQENRKETEKRTQKSLEATPVT